MSKFSFILYEKKRYIPKTIHSVLCFASFWLYFRWLMDPCDSWWRNHMETFSALLAICAGNSPVTGEFPAQRPVTRCFDVFLFDLCLNKRLNKQWWGWWFETPSRQLWRHCNVCMYIRFASLILDIILSRWRNIWWIYVELINIVQQETELSAELLHNSWDVPHFGIV